MNLKQLCKEKGTNINKLADKVGVTPSTLYAISSGDTALNNVGVSLFIAISAELGYTTDELFALLSGAPKSQASIRTLPMPTPLLPLVDSWRKIRASRGFAESSTLCCTTRGKVLRPQNFQRWWTGDAKHIGIRDSLGCSEITLHQLRHSNLSMVARYMSPYDLQRYAGWSSIEPAKVYIHDDISLIQQAINRIGW